MRGDVGLLHALRAADVRLRLRDADQRRSDRLNVTAAGGHRIEQRLRQHLLRHRLLHVDDRRLRRNGDALLESADAQVRVDRCREVGRELDPFALARIEAGQDEGHR